MTPKVRNDVIVFGCAFAGAAILRSVVPPIEGVPNVMVSIAGAAIGWCVAKFIVIRLTHNQKRADLHSTGSTTHEEDKQP